MSNSTHATRSMLGRRKRIASVAAIATCLTAGALTATVQLPDATAAERKSEAASLQKDLDALVGAGAPGAILLVRDGDRSVRLTAGLGDVARKTAMGPDDHFKIASLTKTYTATVVLQLVVEGKLRLSDSVERRLPGVVPNGHNITIRQLLKSAVAPEAPAHHRQTSCASTPPPASAAAKKSGSSRPIERVGSPLAA